MVGCKSLAEYLRSCNEHMDAFKLLSSRTIHRVVGSHKLNSIILFKASGNASIYAHIIIGLCCALVLVQYAEKVISFDHPNPYPKLRKVPEAR